jgi:hypothetical protein
MDQEEIRWESVDWICLADDKDQWWAVVNTVMNPQVPYNAGNFLSTQASVVKSKSLYDRRSVGQ